MEFTPSPVAYLALLAWPPIALLLFLRFRPETAATLVILGGVLLLPARVDFDYPLIPPLGRSTISCLSALAGLLLFHAKRIPALRPGRGIEILMVVLVVGAFLTARGNSDPLAYLEVVVPGMTLGDGVSLAIENVLSIWLPFFLGRSLYRHPDQLRRLFAIIAAAMLGYSLLILVELRLSPQLHRLVYGFHQHEFIQTYRAGGWRPTVFMSHGLALAQFVLFGAAAATALWRVRGAVFRLHAGLVAGYLSGLLVAVKSLSTVLYGAIALPSILFLSSRRQLQLMSVLALLVVAYPLARGADVFPTEALLDAASVVGPDRRQSLAFRFENEEPLLDRARERVWLGWGIFGRYRVRDVESGQDVSVTDGYWIIALGRQGILGFLASFGMVVGPVWFAAFARRRFASRKHRILLAALAWLVVVSAINLLPNAEFNPFILMLAGALQGVVETARPLKRRSARWRGGIRVGRSPEEADDPDTSGSASELRLTVPEGALRRS